MTRAQGVSAEEFVCLESSPENMTREMALEVAYVMPDDWNGFARPVTTALAMGDFLDLWRRNDPNGEWGYATQVGDTLIVTRDDPDEPDQFKQVGVNSEGDALFDLSGWVWILVSD